MGFAIRSIHMQDSYDLTPQVVCDHCGTSIDSTRGSVVYLHEEPYSKRLRFYHAGRPCMPEFIPPGWHTLDLAAFVHHFTKQFNKPAVRSKMPFSCSGKTLDLYKRFGGSNERRPTHEGRPTTTNHRAMKRRQRTPSPSRRNCCPRFYRRCRDYGLKRNIHLNL